MDDNIIQGIFTEQQQIAFDIGVMIGQIRRFMGLKPASYELIKEIWDVILKEEESKNEENERAGCGSC